MPKIRVSSGTTSVLSLQWFTACSLKVWAFYSILNIVPYGLVLTALFDDAIKERAERTSHRRRNGNQIHTLKVFGAGSVVITYSLQSLHLFAMPITMFY